MTRDDVDTFVVNGYTVRIRHDDDPESPREWDNLGTMVCHHRRYDLGDKHSHSDTEQFLLSLIPDDRAALLERWYERHHYQHLIQTVGLRYGSDEYRRISRDLAERYADRRMEEAEKVAIILPVYLYDHSGLAMSVGGFNCPWDSGQVGWVYVTLEDVRREYSCKHVTKAIRDKVIKVMTGEVQTYSEYLGGFVYGFIIEKPDGEHEDSCWGFYGLDDVKKEATGIAERLPPLPESEDGDDAEDERELEPA